MMSPTAIQAALRPETKIAPGSPISIQPLISDAPADSAPTAGCSFRPPSMYSETSLVDLR